MNRRKFIKILLAALILAVVLGFGFIAGKKYEKNSNDEQTISGNGTIYTNASDLRKGLNVALVENAGLTVEAMRASYEGSDSSTAAIDELDSNGQDLAKIIGGVYGEEAQAAFLKMWQDHITYFINYTVSVKNDDKEGKEQALSDLEDYSQEAAGFLAGLNSNLSADSIKPLFVEHRDLIITSLDDYASGKYPESFGEESKAYSQAGDIGDALADGVIKQFPDKFSQ